MRDVTIRKFNRNLANAAMMVSLAFVAGTLPAGAQSAGDSAPRIDASYANYQPPYPDAAQVNGEQGDVVLSVRVGANGKIRGIQIAQTSGFADLDNAAIEGVLRWHFIPAVRDGDTATETTNVKIVYRLPKVALVPNAAAAPAAGH